MSELGWMEPFLVQIDINYLVDRFADELLAFKEENKRFNQIVINTQLSRYAVFVQKNFCSIWIKNRIWGILRSLISYSGKWRSQIYGGTKIERNITLLQQFVLREI